MRRAVKRHRADRSPGAAARLYGGWVACGPYGQSNLDLGASGAGRGVAVYQRSSAGSSQGAIYAVRFRLR